MKKLRLLLLLPICLTLASCGYIPMLSVVIANISDYTVTATSSETNDSYTINSMQTITVDGLKNDVTFTFNNSDKVTVRREQLSYTIENK